MNEKDDSYNSSKIALKKDNRILIAQTPFNPKFIKK